MHISTAEKMYDRLRDAVIDVIEMDRLAGGIVDTSDDARKLELLEGDSVIVADLLRGLGLEIGDYP